MRLNNIFYSREERMNTQNRCLSRTLALLQSSWLLGQWSVTERRLPRRAPSPTQRRLTTDLDAKPFEG